MTSKIPNFTVLLTLLCMQIIPIRMMAQMTHLHTTQKGLSSSSISSIDIDSKGMAWISGLSSLDLFDGQNFYNLIDDNIRGKHQFNTIYGVREYKDNLYWLITSNGLHLYDAKQNKYEHIFLREEEDSVLGYPINTFTDFPKEGYKLVSTSGSSMFVFNTDKMETDMALTKKLQSVVNTLYTECVFVDSSGLLWVNTIDRRFICVDLRTMKLKPFTSDVRFGMFISRQGISKIIELKNHNLMIGTNDGVFIYDRKTNNIRSPKGSQPANLPISTMIETRQGKRLIGSDSRGIWEFDANENLVPYQLPDHLFNLSYAKVRAFAEDSEGTLLVGLFQKGVLVIPQTSDNFVYHAVSPTSNGSNASCITSMMVDKSGNYWVATDGCGVFKCSENNISALQQKVEGLSSQLVQSIITDEKGTIWVGTYGGGVQYFDGTRFVTPNWAEEIKGFFIMSLAYNSAENVIYVGTNGNGVYALDLNNQTAKRISFTMNVNPWTSTLHCSKDGTLWIGTSQGMFFYNAKTGSQGEVKFDKSDLLMTQCITSDADYIYIGTNGGLVKYNPKDNSVVMHFPGQYIMSIIPTADDIWLSSSKEIICFNKKTEEADLYTSFGEYFIGEFHKNSFLSVKGNIMLGCDNGIISFKPEMVKQKKSLCNPLVFTKLRINSEAVTYSADSDDNYTDSNIFTATSVDLPYSCNSINLAFCVPDFSAPERIQYEYILEPYDKAWHKCTVIQAAYYSSLPSGHYKLRVRAYYETNEEMYQEAVIDISIGYPWYNSVWAWMLYIAILALAGYFIYKIMRERARQRRLLSLARQNEQIKEDKLRLFTSITHELRSPLTMIVSPLRQLMSMTDDEETLNLYKVMSRNCNRLLDLVKQITDIRKIDSGQFRLHFSEVDFIKYSDDIFASFTAIATVKRINFTIEHSSPEIMIWLDTVHFEKVLSNILSNAFKFTPEEGKIIVRTRYTVRESKDWLEIRIYNSGSHINHEDLPHIFERFYQGKISESAGSGIGLNLVSELMNLHHGIIDCHNIDPDGVEFILQLPLGSAHLSEEEVLPRAAESKDSQKLDLLDIPENIDTDDLSVSQGTNNENGAVQSGLSNSQLTILVVDDDESLCQYLSEQLSADYNVITAHSGNSAWQTILSKRPDAVVTDIRMPDGDGLELCKRIKSNPETDTTPVILLTSENSDRAQIHSLNLQVDHFISKPFNLLLLKSAIAQVIRVRENLMGRIRRTEIGYDYSAMTIDNAEEKLYVRINEALRRHLDDSSFGVNELAAEVGISRVHLNRKLKERYGITPNNFIRSFRLKQAAYLLAGNKVNISEIAYRVGFSSHSHFSNTFHEFFGMTPKEFYTYYTHTENEAELQKLLKP